MRRRTNRVGRPKAGEPGVAAQTAILDTALDLFAARGVERVTIADIAKATGFNPALIYYYFGNKEELFRSAVTLAVERAFTRFRASRRPDDDPAAVILGWIDTHIREFETIAKLIKLSLDYANDSKGTSGVDKAIRKFYADERDVLRRALDDGIESGAFKGIDAAETATFVSTYLDGVFMRSMILKDFEPLRAITVLKGFIAEHLGVGHNRHGALTTMRRTR